MKKEGLETKTSKKRINIRASKFDIGIHHIEAMKAPRMTESNYVRYTY